MGEYYQKKLNNPYALPDSLYRRTIAIIRDYDRLVEQRDCILNGVPIKIAGLKVRGGKQVDITAEKAIKLSKIDEDIEAIDEALKEIPQEYRCYIFENIRYGYHYPDYAHPSTWSRWRTRFIYYVAKNLNLV